MKHSNVEWEKFKRDARRFDDNPPEKRYGIVNPSVDNPTSEADMLYAGDPRSLRILHIQNWPTVVLRKHLDMIEIAERKKPRGHSSLYPGI